jgi:uncharacterized membrane protein YkoI
MNIYTRYTLITCLSLSGLIACSDKDNEIPLSEVPAEIIAVAQNTLPGIVLDEAEKCTKDDRVVYELEGKLISGEEYEMKITASGKILKIELED